MKNVHVLQIILGVFAICFINLVKASAHKHSFGKERLEDGAFSRFLDNEGLYALLFIDL